MINTRKPIAIDFFCGAGGLSLGFKQAGFNVVAGVDFDPIHAETHTKNFPHSSTVCADIRTLTGTEIRRLAKLSEESTIDVVIGGPPCQGFSMIGKRNLKDPRNFLLQEFCRIVNEIKPRYFVMENVAGLIYGEPRKLLADALRRVKAAGYRWVSPIRILNARDFGVPQSRKRVFILGYQKGQRKPCYPSKHLQFATVRDAIGDLAVLGKYKRLFDSDMFDGKLGTPSLYAKRLLCKQRSSLTGCLRAAHTANTIRRFKATRKGTQEPISRFVRLDYAKTAPTLRAGTSREYGGFTAARPIHPTQARCITVREAARLHSFPDSFHFHPTQWHGFRQVGNSVPPMLGAAVAKCIKKAIRDQL